MDRETWEQIGRLLADADRVRHELNRIAGKYLPVRLLDRTLWRSHRALELLRVKLENCLMDDQRKKGGF
jgi:hypothetical protein